MTRTVTEPGNVRRTVARERGRSIGESVDNPILIVDDEPQQIRWLQDLLEESGYPTSTAENGSQACKMLVSKPFRVVITDLKMPEKNGIEVVEYMRRVQPDCLGIVLTGYGCIEQTVKAMKAGAFDFVSKPIQPQRVLKVIKDGLRLKGLRTEQVGAGEPCELIVGSSPAMAQVRELIEKVAPDNSTVLISGESGTGKELVAKTIHNLSPRRSEPFVVVHCGGMPETLLESELFGHEKGAFTGAHRARIGRFELAHGGTVFLDEIGDIPLHLQFKLLRVLQEKTFERVGGAKSIWADFRVVAATNKDLQREVNEERFRLDLFYRLNVIPLDLPPLRKRGEDILVLSQYFLDLINRAKGRSIDGFSPEVAQLMLEYPWPGNVRELKNLVERLVVLNESGTITPADLPEGFHGRVGSKSIALPSLPDEGVCLDSMVEEYESRLILQALDKCDWVKNRAAKLLNVKRTTLVERMKKRGLKRRDPRQEGLFDRDKTLRLSS